MTARELPHGAAAVLEECRQLAAGFAAGGYRLYLVGGSVRDLWTMEGAGVHDFDFTTDARPTFVKSVLGPMAEAVWTQGERFGTIAALVDGRLVEITTHRAEAYDPSSRKPDVVFSTDVVADLSRRDFTINALAIDVTAAEPELIDPFGGRADLAAGILRTPRGAEDSFGDDPLRMLRAARFIARLGLVADPDVVSAVRSMGGRMAVVSAERIRDELDKLLVIPDPTAGLTFLRETGLADIVLPELSLTPEALSDLPAQLDVRLAAVLWRSGEHGTRDRLRRLKHPGDLIRRVISVVGTVQTMVDHGTTWSDSDLRRLVRSGGDAVDAALAVVGVVGGANATGQLTAALDALGEREDLHDLEPALDGVTVMTRLGIAPGPDVGAAMRFLADLRLDEGVLDPAEVGDRLDQWWAGRRRD